MSINWYPGHMARTRRLMAEDLKNIDLVCELLDARIPRASRNPELRRLCEHKRRLVVLNRCDQAEERENRLWGEYLRARGEQVLLADSRKGGFLNAFTQQARVCCADLIERAEAKGQTPRIRVMVAGIPNVGKSSFINRLLGRRSAVAEDRPGVTRARQWFSLPGGFDLMDTPGLLWPKIENDAMGYLLAFTGTIRDEVLDQEDLACHLIAVLGETAPQALEARYGIDIAPCETTYDALQALAKKRGFLLGRGEVDTARMARVLLDEFRDGKLGRISLETPPRRL